MNFAQLVTTQHTIIQVPEINEKKIRKVFDALLNKKTPSSNPRILYCFEPLELKAESKNGAFTVDGAKALISMVSALFPDRNPIVIVLAYERYGEPAQNALLKLLEESPHNVWVSLLYNPETTIIPTIVSRTLNLTKSSPFAEKASILDLRQKLSPNQIIRLQKVLAKADKLPNSWISDFKKALKSAK